MIGERENFNQESDYGKLVMRSYNIDGNEINAFYDSSDALVFVLDNTVTARKQNVLLVINPDGDKKWDEILSGDYGIDLETIRPKQDNKYQKLDIEYSGLSVYGDLINSYNAGDSLEEALKQLSVLRDSAARHSAMMRLNAANEIITKTNATIIKTKESVVRLQARLKTLRAKLAEAKKGIGRGPTKQSAAKILKLESQIEATNEKIKRANERLKSAQRRLETATVDAELAGNLLNQSDEESKFVEKSDGPLIVAPQRSVSKVKKAPVPEIIQDMPIEEVKENISDIDFDYDDKDEHMDENSTEEVKDDEEQNEIKPLFNEDPQILNEEIAFKPINFEPPVVPDIHKDEEETDVPVIKEESTEITETTEKPVLDSMMPVIPVPEYTPTEEESVPQPLDVVEENTTETVEEVVEQEPLKLKPVTEEVRQPEPVIEEKIEDTTVKIEDNTPNEIPFVRPVPPMPVMPYVASNDGVVHEPGNTRSKPTFLYYLLLIILIVLAVFTLWLYQKNVEPTAPVLTTTVEQTETNAKQTTFLKKQSKPSKRAVAQENVDDLPVFLDEKPETDKAVEPVETVVEEESPVVEEPEQDEEITDFAAPQVIDSVPARVTTSGQDQDVQSGLKSEEEILVNKPMYEPGSKYDEMFVSEEDDVGYIDVTDEYEQSGTEYVDGEIIYDDQPEEEQMLEYSDQDPFFDAEEAEYQAEQQSELYYEE